MEPRGRTGNYPVTLADSGRSYPRSQVRHGFCVALERSHLNHYPIPHRPSQNGRMMGAKGRTRIYKVTGKGI
jgi:hypothetical protein